MINKIIKFLPALFAVCIMATAVSVAVPVSYAAEGKGNAATESLDFMTEPPQTKTVRGAGEGTVTYEPKGDGSAVITMDNATTESYFTVSYNGPNYVNAALAATGEITLVLVGKNTVYIDSSSCSPLFFYDANVTVSGEGSLNICYKNDSSQNFNATPFHVCGNYAVSGSSFADTGNLTVESGSIIISAKGSSGSGAVTANNDITIKGGSITTEGRATGLYSVYRDVIALGGEIKCTDFTANGIYARRGGIRVDGAKVTLESEQDRYVFGMYSKADGEEVSENAGKISVESGELFVKSPYLGIYAFGSPELEGSGSISISGGIVNVECKNAKNLVAGIYAEIADDSPNGKINVTGGNVCVNTQSDYAEEDGNSVGICATGKAEFSDCSVTVNASGAEKVKAYAVSAGSVMLDCDFSLAGTTGATDVPPQFGAGIIPSASASGAEGEYETYDPNKHGTYKYIVYETVTPEPSVPITGDGGLPAGAIVGIALGSAAAIAAVIVIVLVIKKRKTI